MILPFLTGSGELPTPSTFKGVPDVEWPRDIFTFFYIYYSINGFLLAFSIMANEAFFIVNVAMLSNRFATIADILQLLNYAGVRDRIKDKRIIKDSYIMHVEVLE